MAFPLIQTKLYIPLAHHLLPRLHLIQTLEEGRYQSHRLFLISSSAGSGKTSLLSAWAAQHPGEFAWVSLDEGDNEMGRFWRYVIAAIQTTQPGFGHEASELLNSPQPVPVQTVLVALINELAKLTTRVTLVLDDYHAISNAEIHSGIAFLSDHLAPQVSLVISTRADPPLPIVRLRAHNQLTEIREANLRFSVDETATFFGTMGLHFEDADLFAIESRTEGWIAGLQLIGLALKIPTSTQVSQDPHAFITTFTGSNQYILEYLAEEVLSRLDTRVQDFLVKTSIAEQICAGLCAEIIGQPEGNERACQAILNDLERANLFTIPLDQEHAWYRYHHLFADLLSHRLIETYSTSDIQELHCRASVWMEDNNLLDEAIHHALLGKDYEFAANIIENLARDMMYAGRVNALKQWIQALPDTCLKSHLRLKLFETWIDLLQGICDLSKQKIQETEQLIQALPPTPENNQLKVELMVILCRFIAISGDSTQAIQLANDALRVLPESDLASRARVQSALAIAYGIDGEVEQAEAAFRECFRLARISEYYSLAAHTTMMVALGNARFGRLREPARYLQELIELGAPSRQKVFYPAGQADIGLASIYLEWNNLDKAEELLDQGLTLCSQSGLDGLFSGLILKARLRQARGDFNGALEEVRSAEERFQRKDHDTANRQVQALLAIGDVETAALFIPPIKSILNADRSIQRIPALFLEGLKITLARILIANGAIEEALSLLEPVQREAERGRRFGHLIEICLLRSAALQEQGDTGIVPASLQFMKRALELAEPEGFTTLFLEMGPNILPLLHAVTRDSTASQSAIRQAGILLEAFSGKDHLLPTPANQQDKIIIERTLQDFDLSQRELEILRLIGAGYSNQDIADRLVITLHTVKKHSSHIFSKLGVTSRTQAVALARQAGLL